MTHIGFLYRGGPTVHLSLNEVVALLVLVFQYDVYPTVALQENAFFGDNLKSFSAREQIRDPKLECPPPLGGVVIAPASLCADCFHLVLQLRSKGVGRQ